VARARSQCLSVKSLRLGPYQSAQMNHDQIVSVRPLACGDCESEIYGRLIPACETGISVRPMIFRRSLHRSGSTQEPVPKMSMRSRVGPQPPQRS
jgi:hypothetical protein